MIVAEYKRRENQQKLTLDNQVNSW
jgi:hypothetical protein